VPSLVVDKHNMNFWREAKGLFQKHKTGVLATSAATAISLAIAAEHWLLYHHIYSKVLPEFRRETEPNFQDLLRKIDNMTNETIQEKIGLHSRDIAKISSSYEELNRNKEELQRFMGPGASVMIPSLFEDISNIRNQINQMKAQQDAMDKTNRQTAATTLQLEHQMNAREQEWEEKHSETVDATNDEISRLNDKTDELAISMAKLEKRFANKKSPNDLRRGSF